MIAIDLGARTASEVAAVVRALGQHRYVAGRAHLVHALVYDALDGAPFDELEEGVRWAKGVLSDANIDAASRDERLLRRASDAEVAAALSAFWSAGRVAERAKERLRASLARLELLGGAGAPFDPAAEEAMHPVLVDAGWELVPLHALDPERHKGAIAAFGERVLYEAAAFEEETAIPPVVPLHELPAIGEAELLAGVGDDGALVEPLTLWVEGSATYHEYVVRGVRKAARLE